MRIFERESYVLAVGTSFLYLMAYFRILATSEFYGVPIQFMSVDLLQLTQSALSGLISLSGMAITPLFVFVWLARGAKKPKIIYFFILAVFLAAITFFPLKNDENSSAVVMSLITFILTMGLYGFPRYFSSNRPFAKFVVERLNGEVGGFFSLKKNKAIVFVLVFSAPIAISYFATYMASYTLNKYNVFCKNDCYAMISVSQDNVIAKKVVNGRLADGYFIFKAEALGNVEINRVNIRSLNSSERASSGKIINLNPLPSERI